MPNIITKGNRLTVQWKNHESGKWERKATGLPIGKEKECLEVGITLERASQAKAGGILSAGKVESLVLDTVLAVNKGNKLTVGVAVEGWLEKRRKDTKVETFRAKEMTVRHLKGFFGSEWAKLPLTKVSKEFGEKFRDHLAGEGYALGTIKLRLAVASEIWNTLIDDGKTLVNPFRRVKALPLPVDHEEKPKALTADELAKLFSYTSKKAEHIQEKKLFMSIAYYTGLRCVDVAKLKWSNIDLEKGEIRLFPQKQTDENRKLMHVPICSELVRILKGIQRVGDSVLPIFAARGNKWAALTFTFYFQYCHIPGGIHRFRHTFAQNLNLLGAPLNVQCRLTHHTLKGAHFTYIEATMEQMRAFVERLPKHP